MHNSMAETARVPGRQPAPGMVHGAAMSAAAITNADVAQAVAQGLREAERGRHAVKTIARRTGAAAATVKAWLAAQNAPQADKLLLLLDEYPEVERRIRALRRREDEGALTARERAALEAMRRIVEGL